MQGPLAGSGIFALAEGPIIIEDPSTPTTGVVKGGVVMEADLPANFIENGKFKCAIVQMASETQVGAWGFSQYEQLWMPYAVLGGMTFGILILLTILLKRRDPV